MAIFGLIIPVAGWALGGAALMLVDNDWVEWSKDAILRATIWNTAGSLVIACAVAGYALVAPCRAVVLVWNAGSADALLQVEGATVPLASSRGSRWYLRAPKSPTALSTVRGPKDLPPAAISTGVYLLNLSTSESVHFAPVRYAADAVRGYAEAQRSAENLLGFNQPRSFGQGWHRLHDDPNVKIFDFNETPPSQLKSANLAEEHFTLFVR